MDHPLDRARTRLGDRPCRILFSEGEDARIRQAALILLDTLPGAELILLGSLEAPTHAAAHRLRVVDPHGIEGAEQLAQLYTANRPDTAIGIARRLVRKPLYHAGLMLKAGQADCMVAGIACPTARVIEAAMLTIGLVEGVSVPSSFFMMLPHPALSGRPIMLADCAVNVAPSPSELAAIGVASAHSWMQLMGSEPLTAFLSFSTHGSASHPAATAVQQAKAIAAAQCPRFSFEGELQADAALNPRIARLKTKSAGPVAGQANILIFPDLGAANIGYKLLQEIGGATALGPFLQGFERPVSDLSRGASVQDIVDTTIITASMALDTQTS